MSTYFYMECQDHDPLGGMDDLSPRQQAAVGRYEAKAGRYRERRTPPTNRDRWAAFQAREEADENRRRYGGH